MKRLYWIPLFLSTTFLFGQAPSGSLTKLTLDDVLGGPGAAVGFRGRGETELSPDGKFKLAQVNGQLILKSLDGAPDKVIDSSSAPKSDFQWSQDGKHIAYVSAGQVWVTTKDGATATQLTHDPKGPGDPRGATDGHIQWNPNGRWILYESGTKGFNELYVVSQDGGMPHLIAATEIYHGKDVIATNVAQDHGDAVASDRFDARPQWSPDGTRISYTERSREFFSGKLKVLRFDSEQGIAVGPALDLYTAKNDPEEHGR